MRGEQEAADAVEEILVEEAFKWAHFMNMNLDPETMRDEMAMWVRKALKLTLNSQVGQ